MKSSQESIFKTIWFILLAGIFLAIYLFSVQSSWEVPQRAQWAINFMLWYLYFVCARTIILLGLSFYEYLSTQTLPDVENPPLVSIIIPGYNEGAVIQNSIYSASKIDYPNLEILVVDDGSTDDTFEKALELQKDHKVRIVTKTNGGKSSALNFGIQQALGDYILCMDADSELNSNVINEAIPYFEKNSLLGAIAGNVYVGNSKGLLPLFQKLEYIIGLNFHKKAQSALNMVMIVPGPIGLFKKSVILEVGGYDNDTFAEDCDLTLKILMAGYHIKYSSTMTATTEAPDTFQQLCTQRYRWARGTIQAILKNMKKVFTKKDLSLRNNFIMAYITLETMVIPTINFLFAMLTIIYALSYGSTSLYGPFFLGLILMDCAIALYSILIEKQIFSMFFLSIISRVTYGFSLEIMRFYSMIDELLKIPMKWGNLKRKGMNSDG